MKCPNCSAGPFRSPRGLRQHQARAKCQPSGRFYFYASDVSVEVNGQKVTSFKEVSFDSTKDKAPRVLQGAKLEGFKLVDALGVLERLR